MTSKKSSFTASKLNQEYETVLAEEFKKTSAKDRHRLIERGLSLDPIQTEGVKEVSIESIVSAKFFLRSNEQDTMDDLGLAAQLDPVKVAAAGEKYYLVDGHRRLAHAKANGAEKVTVQIVGTVVCQSQIGMARGREMVKVKKPLTIVELTRGLMHLQEQIIKDFGTDAFFSHGGNRRKKGVTQQSLSDYIAETLKLKGSIVGTLLRFGSNVGPTGLDALLERDGVREISLRNINKVNARLKTANLAKKIDDRVLQLTKEGATQEELLRVAGELASAEILQSAIPSCDEDNDNDDDDNEEEIDAKDMPNSPEPRNKNEKPDRGEGSRVSNSTRKMNPLKIATKIEEFQKVLQQMRINLESCGQMRSLNSPELENLYKQAEDQWSQICIQLTHAGIG